MTEKSPDGQMVLQLAAFRGRSMIAPTLVLHPMKYVSKCGFGAIRIRVSRYYHTYEDPRTMRRDKKKQARPRSRLLRLYRAAYPS